MCNPIEPSRSLAPTRARLDGLNKRSRFRIVMARSAGCGSAAALRRRVPSAGTLSHTSDGKARVDDGQKCGATQNRGELHAVQLAWHCHQSLAAPPPRLDFPASRPTAATNRKARASMMRTMRGDSLPVCVPRMSSARGANAECLAPPLCRDRAGRPGSRSPWRCAR